ncbi:MAG: hypothetical protein KAX05_09005, partial [Bacteroidales bacterium]|nr:hypothetical protein [Bacteroidales bacterium]
MRKLLLLLLVQISFLGAVIAQPTGTSWYYQNFTGLILQDLDNYDDLIGGIWDTTGATTTSQHWEIYSGIWSGDNGTNRSDILFIDSDADVDNMQNEIITARIDLPREPDLPGEVPSNYYLDFDWWSDQGNLGGGTDPELDPDAAITIEVKFHDGTSWGTTWTEIWSEDDQTRLEETTISTPGGGDFDWDDYASDVEGWYTSEIDLTDIAGHQPDSIILRVTYNGINAGDFALDNLDIRYEAIPEYEVDIRLEDDYYYIPWLFAKDMDMDFIATVTQNTDSTFDETDKRIELYLEGSLVGYTAMKNSDFSSGNVHEYSFTNIVDEFPVEDNPHYLFYVTENITGESSKTEQLYLDDDYYSRDNDVETTYLNADLSTPGIGVLYEVSNVEHFDDVHIEFNTIGVDFSYDLIKVSGPDATSGEVIYSSGTQSTSPDFSHNPDDIILETGYYIIMVNQLTSADVDLNQDDQNDGFYYRGTASSFTKVEDEGWPMIRMFLQPNRKPAFSIGTEYDHLITEGQQLSYVVYAEDEDEDLVGFRRIDPDQAWLRASWLSIVDNGDTTFTLSGTPTETGSYEFDMRIGDAEGDSTTQTFNFDVIDPNSLDFEENFDVSSAPWSNNEAWTTIEDAGGYGSAVTWDYTYEYDSYADDEFKSDFYVAEMFGENFVVQEEWLVSPGIIIPALSADSDSTVLLEF